MSYLAIPEFFLDSSLPRIQINGDFDKIIHVNSSNPLDFIVSQEAKFLLSFFWFDIGLDFGLELGLGLSN